MQVTLLAGRAGVGRRVGLVTVVGLWTVGDLVTGGAVGRVVVSVAGHMSASQTQRFRAPFESVQARALQVFSVVPWMQHSGF